MNSPDRDAFDDLPILAELREHLEARFGLAARPAPLADGTSERRINGNRSRAARARLNAGLRILPMVAAAAVAVAVLVVALTMIHRGRPAARVPVTPARHGSRPPGRVPTTTPPAEQKLINAAQRRTISRDPACKVPTNGALGATFVHRAPPQALLSVLGVLRRPALPADRSTRMLMHNGFDVGAGVYVDYIRRARTAYGKSFYLVPEARITPFGAIPDRCYRELRAALKHELRAAPAGLAAPTLHLQAQQLSIQRLQAKQAEGLCFAAVSLGFHGKLGGVDEGCTPGVPAVRSYLDNGIGEGDHAGGSITATVVPDQVATVTVEYAAAGRDPARTLTSTAVNNVVVFKIPRRTAHQPFPTKVIERAADGSVIPPTPTSQTGG